MRLFKRATALVAVEMPTSRKQIIVHNPTDTADDAYLQIGRIRVEFDASTRESRTAALEALAGLQYSARQLERHLRVIRVAPEHRRIR